MCIVHQYNFSIILLRSEPKCHFFLPLLNISLSLSLSLTLALESDLLLFHHLSFGSSLASIKQTKSYAVALRIKYQLIFTFLFYLSFFEVLSFCPSIPRIDVEARPVIDKNKCRTDANTQHTNLMYCCCIFALNDAQHKHTAHTVLIIEHDVVFIMVCQTIKRKLWITIVNKCELNVSKWTVIVKYLLDSLAHKWFIECKLCHGLLLILIFGTIHWSHGIHDFRFSNNIHKEEEKKFNGYF